MFREFLQGLASQKNRLPLNHEIGAKAPVQRYGRLIPIKHGPANERSFLPLSRAGDASKKGRRDSESAKFGTHKQIFEVQSGASPG